MPFEKIPHSPEETHTHEISDDTSPETNEDENDLLVILDETPEEMDQKIADIRSHLPKSQSDDFYAQAAQTLESLRKLGESISVSPEEIHSVERLQLDALWKQLDALKEENVRLAEQLDREQSAMASDIKGMEQSANRAQIKEMKVIAGRIARLSEIISIKAKHQISDTVYKKGFASVIGTIKAQEVLHENIDPKAAISGIITHYKIGSHALTILDRPKSMKILHTGEELPINADQDNTTFEALSRVIAENLDSKDKIRVSVDPKHHALVLDFSGCDKERLKSSKNLFAHLGLNENIDTLSIMLYPDKKTFDALKKKLSDEISNSGA
ncbi:MAG: hypothetical protein HY453_02440 [Parcubacteria group bacterium]|nr:hypothetical protein [Parcubacteria group bacterium]